MRIVLFWGLGILLLSCSHKNETTANLNEIEITDTVTSVKKVSDSSDSIESEETETYDFKSQAEYNEESYNGCVEYNASIENEWKSLVIALSQYQDELTAEKNAWEKYQKAVRKVSSYGNYGSSTPMYVNAVIGQGIRLREVSIHNLYLYTQGKPVHFSKTIFTTAKITEAYTSFIKAVGNEDEEIMADKANCQESLRKEQECWNNWMYSRLLFSEKLQSDLKRVYDNCTNMVKRTKLLQLKNQNQALGMCGHEVMECVLPDDCSDKVLLEYPGFDVVWKKHCEDTSWYPNFK